MSVSIKAGHNENTFIDKVQLVRRNPITGEETVLAETKYICEVPALGLRLHVSGDSEEQVRDWLLHDLNRRFGGQRYKELPPGTVVRAAKPEEANLVEEAQTVIAQKALPLPPKG